MFLKAKYESKNKGIRPNKKAPEKSEAFDLYFEIAILQP